jgi:hypothetical protein
MKILVACERSGRVREAFRKKGHDAYSCDVVPADDNSPHHIQDDVLKHLDEGWDMMIAFPPCTYLANSGVRWMYNKDGSINRDRFNKMEDAARFFNALLDAPISKIVIENPIHHQFARYRIKQKYNQIVQPWLFGHGETKATCIWLKNVDYLMPTVTVEGREHRIHEMPPTDDRGIKRSLTYQGIADAMAEQWG